MKKIFITFFMLCAITAASFSQATFVKGTNIFSAGIGLGSNYYGSGYKMTVPPIFASYEYGVVDNLFNDGKGAIGVGGLIGYTGASWKYVDTSYNVNYMTFAAKGNLHYEFVEKLDTYAGLTLGYYTVNHSVSDKSIPWDGGAGSFAWGLNVGARYYFSPNIAGMAELGYGISVLNIGVSFKF